MTLTEFVNGIMLWPALIVIVLSAAKALAQTRHRDHDGLIDQTALSAVTTTIFGALAAIAIAIVPHLMPLIPVPIGDNPTMAAVTLGPLATAIGHAWIWAAIGAAIVWLTALATALVTTRVYHAQQRRIHATEPEHAYAHSAP